MTHNFNNLNSFLAHVFRRLIHVGIIICPWLYYWYGDQIASYFYTNKDLLILFILILIILFELVRLKQKWLIFGQRHYESNCISAVAWSAIGISLVLWFAPKAGYQNAAYGFPLITSLALVDPLLGELRLFKVSLPWQLLLGWSLVLIIWLASTYFLSTPMIWALVLPPIIVACEYPNIKNIDDNFLILVVPLVIILVLNTLLPI